MADLDRLVAMLKGAGEETRLRLLALLSRGELPVKDLTEILGQSQPRVSRHLRLLVEAGLVVRHAEGAWAYFGLCDEGEAGRLVGTIVGDICPRDPRVAGDREALKRVREKQQRRAEAYFAKVAGSWDALRRLHVSEAAIEESILEVLGGHKVSRLLDLGTGTGRMLELLAPLYDHGIGVDLSRDMIGVARAKLAGAGLTHAQGRLGDILDLESGAPVDLVTLHQVLHYFDDPGRVLESAAAQLVAGGRMVVVDLAPHDLEFLRTEHAHRRLGLSREQMQAWARGAGLKILRVVEHARPEHGQGLKVCLWLLEKTE